MARKSPTILQEELYPSSAEAAREELDDARLVDLDVDEESPFLRGVERQHRGHRDAERDQGANHGSDGRRYRAQHFLHPAVAAEDTTGTDSVGRVSECDALCAQPA